MRIKTDQHSSHIRYCSSKKGTAENYNCKPSISSFRDILCACSPSLSCVARDCSSSLFLFVILAEMVTRCFVKVAGTIVVSVCWPSPSTFVSRWLQSQVEQSDHNIVCDLSRTAKHSLQVVHFFQILLQGKKSSITPNILYAAHSDCRAAPRAQMMISARPPPCLEKRKCVSNTNNSSYSTVASCLHVDTRHIIE